MTATREDLRDDLLAMVEAAPELPRDGRQYLADVFLNELEARFRLVPRTRKAGWSDELETVASMVLQAVRRWWPAMAIGAGLLLLLPLLLLPFFVLSHAPVLLLVLGFLLVRRFGGPGMRRRHGPPHRRLA